MDIVQGASQLASSEENSSSEEEVIVYDKERAKRIRMGLPVAKGKVAEPTSTISTPSAADSLGAPCSTKSTASSDKPAAALPKPSASMNGMWTHPYYDQTGNDGRGSLAPGPDDAERAQLISEHWLRAMNFLDEDPATSTNHSMSRSSDEGTPHVTGSVAASSEEYFEPPMTSEEQAERQHWEALKANMARLGFDRSPFVPRTFAEFREFQKGGKGSKKQTSAAETGHVAVGMNKRLVQASMADGLTLVTGRKSIWSEDCKQNGHVDWPTPEEYKQSGTTLPLPRVQQLDPQFAHLRPQLPRFGPDVPPKYRQVAEWALRPKFDGVTTEEAPDLELPTAEIELEGLDSFTRQLILDIDNEE